MWVLSVAHKCMYICLYVCTIYCHVMNSGVMITKSNAQTFDILPLFMHFFPSHTIFIYTNTYIYIFTHTYVCAFTTLYRPFVVSRLTRAATFHTLYPPVCMQLQRRRLPWGLCAAKDARLLTLFCCNCLLHFIFRIVLHVCMCCCCFLLHASIIILIF